MPNTGPSGPEQIWPLFGLRITAGPLELRPVSDADLPALVDLALSGVHAPEAMPFTHPWTDVPDAELGRSTAAYHWRTRADCSPAAWKLECVVRWHGEVVGAQGLTTKDYLVTRSGQTGSWLGLRHHGHGIGTLMRQTMCAFAFDHLDAQEVTSGAWVDNPASLAVSRKVGYLPNGQSRRERRPGELAVHQELVLTPDRLVRHGFDLRVEGLPEARQFLGLDPG